MKAKEIQLTFMDEMLKNHRKTKKGFFDKIDELIDWHPLRTLIEAEYHPRSSFTGRPGYDGITLFKMDMIRKWYHLSDREVELRVNDSLSLAHFIGVSFETNIPDGSTLWRFRRSLSNTGAYTKLWENLEHQLTEADKKVKLGKIVNPSLVKPSYHLRKRRKTHPRKKSQD